MLHPSSHWMPMFLLLVCPMLAVAEQQWGDLTGRITVAGNVEGGSPNSVSIDAKSRGLANVAVYMIRDRKAKEETPVHPSYNKSAKDKIELVIQSNQFQPRMLLMRTSQTMVQRNRDQQAHNARIDFIRNLPR